MYGHVVLPIRRFFETHSNSVAFTDLGSPPKSTLQHWNYGIVPLLPRCFGFCPCLNRVILVRWTGQKSNDFQVEAWWGWRQGEDLWRAIRGTVEQEKEVAGHGCSNVLSSRVIERESRKESASKLQDVWTYSNSQSSGSLSLKSRQDEPSRSR